jgi:hypothetical protein
VAESSVELTASGIDRPLVAYGRCPPSRGPGTRATVWDARGGDKRVVASRGRADPIGLHAIMRMAGGGRTLSRRGHRHR